MKQAGIGRRTVQYNPARGSRKAQMDAYAAAIKVMRGEFEGDVSKAVASIKGTDPEVRSRYTARTWATRRQLYGPSGRGNMAAAKKHSKRNWPWSKRTYSAKTKTWTRAKGSGKKSISYRVHSPRIKAAVKVATPKRTTSSKAPAATKYPALFGTAYEKLSPSQQALVRRAMNYQKRNPKAGSFERCVAAVSKRGGVTDPSAVCAASEMRKPGGKSELLAAARRGKLAAMSAKNPFVTMTEGKATAQIFQIAPHEFTVNLGDETKQFKTFKAAQSWARLRLHEVSNPRGIRVKVYARKPTKTRNPMDQAAKLYQEFHGFPSTEVIEFVEQVHFHSVTTSLGPLVSMIVRIGKNEPFRLNMDPTDAKIEDVVYLTSTEDGRQLIPVGGNQSVPIDQLGKFGLDKEDQRDHMLLGEIQQITYRTKKTFEEDGQVAIDFYHDLGGEHSKGKLPVLIYKPRNPSMEIAGGRYFIGKPDKSLGGVSPGIVG